MPTRAVRLDHVQVAMPRGEEARAREFYGRLLGLTEIPKPGETAARGGVWFQCGAMQVHLGVEDGFRAAQKAHPAFVVEGYAELLVALQANGYPVQPDTSVPGWVRAFTRDPFGNRVELISSEQPGR
ncbi:MAG TPA: VOC family protein [Mizugakiibacter sp.]